MISFILATDFVDRNEGMQIKVTRLSLFDNQPDNDSLSSCKILIYGLIWLKDSYLLPCTDLFNWNPLFITLFLIDKSP